MSEFNDPGEWDAASYTADPVDVMEPLEPSVSEYRQCALKFLAVFNAVDQWMCATHTGNPPRKWYSVSLALGLMSTRGRSETSVAVELGVCRAAISKDVVTILRLAHLEDNPAWGLKSAENRETYKRTNGRRRLGDVARALIEADIPRA
jgi:hypothetical protein